MTSNDALEKQPWQKRPLTKILAVVVVYVPLYVFALWSQLSQQTTTLEELFLYPLLLGGVDVLLILLIYRFVFREPVASLNLKSGNWKTDLLAGILGKALLPLAELFGFHLDRA